MRIKAEMIGAKTHSSTVGTIKVKAEHALMFFNEGRFDLLEGVKESGELIPLKEMSRDELRKIAKDIEGYKGNLSKAKLIELINSESINAK